MAAAALSASALQADPQHLEIEAGSPGEYVVSWDGVAGRTYFIQYAMTLADPTDWSYFPVIESGAGSEIEWVFAPTEPELYLRLVYTDVVVGNPGLADFDGDGVSTQDELDKLNTDPFKWDTDGNGIDDGSEDFDGDGLTDIEEMNIGTNPLIDDVADVTDDDPQPEPPGTYQLVVTGTGDEPVNNTRTINTPINGPSKYLVVVAVDSDEFPEWTRDQSEYNDKVSWKVEADFVEWQSGDLEVNPLHQDWLDGIAEGRSFRGYQPSSFVLVDVLELTPDPGGSQPSVEVFFDLTVENVGDAQYPTTAIMALIPLDLQPTPEMIGSLGDEVESNLGVNGERHFVTTKKNAHLNDDFVKFEMKNLSNEDFDQFLEYESDGQSDPVDTRKRLVSRGAAAKKTFEVKLRDKFGGGEIDKMNVWVTWATLGIDPQHSLANAFFTGPDPDDASKYKQGADIRFKADYLPTSLFDEAADVPKLNEANETLPPGPQVLGANKRFDMSRQVDVVINNVAQAIQNADPDWADFAGLDFPENPIEANDDEHSLGETTPYDPTVSIATDKDVPTQRLGTNLGALGDQYDVDAHFREFARVNIGDRWYMASEQFEVTMSWRMLRAQGANGPEWQDNGGSVQSP